MKKKIFVITGEASGDLLAYDVLKNIDFENFEVAGILGSNLKKLPIKEVFDNSEITFFGIVDVLKNIFFIKRKIKQTTDYIEEFKPDIVFSIDSPDFIFEVSKNIRKRDKVKTKFFHYVAPTIWAWREKRGIKIKKLLDKVYLLFDFEKKIFDKYNINNQFVGHPFFENFVPEAFEKERRNSNLISFCPGSRRSEILKFLPLFKEVIKKLDKKYKFHFGVTKKFENYIKNQIKDINSECIVESDEIKKINNYRKSLLTISKSGTVSLDLCKSQTPIITIYKFSLLNYLLIKPFVTSKFANIINVMAGKEIIPELIQFNCTSEKILRKIEELVSNKDHLSQMVYDYNIILKRISNLNTSNLIFEDLIKNIN